MLLVHQVGTVKIGEVVRYTLTYIPSQDRILPSPERLHLRIRNTCALVLRGAFVHGPYNLACCAYPATFNPNERFQNPRRYGVPEFEPMVKAASYWECELLVPDTIRQDAGAGVSSPSAAGSGAGGVFGKGPEHDGESVSWIIEVASQVIFSSSAAVSFELTLARDKKSLDLNAAGSGVPAGAQPGKVSDHQSVPEPRSGSGRHHHAISHHPARQNNGAQPKGVYSRAIRLKVEDTGVLWNTPPLPRWQDGRGEKTAMPASELCAKDGKLVPRPDRVKQKQKKIHLVVLSHGLHSNLGSDMLFLKESIDTAVKKAKVDAKKRRAKERADKAEKRGRTASKESPDAEGQSRDKSRNGTHDIGPDENGEEASRSTDSAQPEQETSHYEEEEEEDDDDDDDDDDEEVIVRGFSGNANRTEKGIKYLGKRLARYILAMTYPDQPYLPPSSKASWASLWADTAAADSKHHPGDQTAADKAGIEDPEFRPFKITSISFIGHSLGGLIQTYAIAYCQKHSPQIFDLIKPINFIALATPFLGLGNENPLYVRFALDSGLVGRTGQDLGLAWRAPALARSGFDALMSNLGDMAQKKLKGEHHPESKPLLRILPTGPAHAALKKFRNRTVYSNVVNDGIVPLRTSCLLFLDWQGLGRVEKARRDAGLVGTAIGFGWAELTGANLLTARRPQLPLNDEEEDESGATTPLQGESHVVPQPSQDAMLEDDRQSLMAVSVNVPYRESSEQSGTDSTTSTLSSFFSSLFRSSDGSRSPTSMPKSPSTTTTATSTTTLTSSKQSLIYRRSQTIKSESSASAVSSSTRRSRVTSGSEYDEESEPGGGFGSGFAPPRTTLFESAHDLINPQVPDMQYLLDPAKRPRTIFHDRVYHPEDIPPPPLKRRGTGTKGVLRRGTGKMEDMSSGATTPTSGHPSQQSEGQDSSTGRTSEPSPTINSTNNNTGTSNSNTTKTSSKPSAPSSPVKDGSLEVSNMRVEEKIARAYHRDLSWRKVLVKLEPDAHNNIIVRRMFANAFGWPVVHHLVEAHFSDSATARERDEVEGGGERAKGVGAPPDEHGGETKTGAESVGLEGEKERTEAAADNEEGEEKSIAKIHRTDSEDREAEDAVPDLPTTPSMTAQTPASSTLNISADDGGKGASHQHHQHQHHLQPSSPRRLLARADSMTWSERDWADSEIDSDTDILGPSATSAEKTKAVAAAPREHGASSSSGSGGGGGGAAGADAAGGWNWTEKIVGKKPAHRTRGGKATANKGEPRDDSPEAKLKLKTT